jgi:allantoate deiminase
MAAPRLTIDRTKSAGRIAADIEVLSGPDYTSAPDAIRRYAYMEEYRRTLDFFRERLGELGFETYDDPVGTLVARNRPRDGRAYGIGSHCDSNRNGGRYDGTLGVVVALEVCRLDRELGLGLPLQVISFLEEEGSGFGQMLLGSRIMAQRVDERELREEFRAIDDGRPFWEHAREAGFQPERWRESIHVLDGLEAWIETHIEQGRVLQDNAERIGVVTAIAGYLHADLTIRGRADHAGATPMGARLDAGALAAECIVELERLGVAAGGGLVATVGEIAFTPGLINVIPGEARISLDIRGVDDAAVLQVGRDIERFAAGRAAERGLSVELRERQSVPVSPMDERVVGALAEAAAASGAPHRLMPSGAAHDTACVAPHVPSAMVFIPCLDGISHSPAERADPADAALAAEVVANALLALEQTREERSGQREERL